LVCLPDGSTEGAHPRSPAGGGGAGRFTSRLPAGKEMVIAYHPQTGVKQATQEEGWWERRKKDLDGLECLAEARARFIIYLPGDVLTETGHSLKEMGQGLIEGLKDMVKLLLKTTLVGALLVGGVAGAVSGGTLAVPGAVVGGELGLDVGMAWLWIQGLKFLAEYLISKLGDVNRLLEAGVKAAWAVRGKKDPERAAGIDAAARLFSKAEAIMLRLLLEAIIIAMVTKGVGKVAGRLKNSGLGKKFGEWVESNHQKLIDDPKLNPDKRMSTRSDGGATGKNESKQSEPQSNKPAAPVANKIKVSPKRRAHILDGDATGGGHGAGRKIPGKSEFPSSLTDDQVISGMESIANNPANYPGGKIPTGGRVKISGDINRVRTTVIVEPAGEGVITGWPEGVPRNPMP
jgi:uncharacterized protein YidB (DUF937 family)